MDNNLILTTEMFEEAEKYWLNNLNREIIEPDLPGDFPRTGQYETGSFNMDFQPQIARRLIQISKDNDFLLNVILLTVFKITIYKFTGQNDITVTSPVLKTSRQSYNTCIALKDTLSPGMTFKELLMKVKETAGNGYKYQYYPIRKLIKLLKIENSLSIFKFIFLLKNIHETGFIADKINNGENDIIVSIEKTGQQLAAEFTYNAKLFKKETIKRISDGYNHLLAAILNDTDIPLADLNLITHQQKKVILEDFNNTRTDFPHDRTLPQLFEQMVRERSEEIVSIEMTPSSRASITYRRMAEKMNRLALHLQHKSLAPGSIVSVMLDHSIDLMVGLLGILKAGCVYLPLDPDYPADRINYMLKDSVASDLIVSTQLLHKTIGFSGDITTLEAGEVQNPAFTRQSGATFTPPEASATDTAYVIYTSGSTGKPKGIAVTHRNVARLVQNMNYIRFHPQDRMLPTGAIAFDITTFELWAPLLNGVRIYFTDENTLLDAQLLAQFINDNKINILHLIPQLFNQMAAQKVEMFERLKYLLVGGDLVRPRYVNKVREHCKELIILQMYGPTENTTFTTYFPVDRTYEGSIPIGKPVSNTSVYILDESLNLQPQGIVGELCTSGAGIALGYLNNPEMTADKFIANPFAPGEIMYRTGDLAHWLSDNSGNIQFIGRRDNQVKIRGYRIELGEIESVLTAHDQIEEAVVATKSDEQKNLFLCAYFTSALQVESNQLREYLAAQLPDYMIPLFFVQLEQMPLTPNGKIDRKALPEPELKNEDHYQAPRDDVEKALVRIWADVLNLEKEVIGIDSNFFRLGGHSLKATLLALNIHKELNVKLTMNQVFNMPTIRTSAAFIKGADQFIYCPIQPVEKREYYPLSSAQMRLYIIQQLDVHQTVFNTLSMVTLEGDLDGERLENSFRKLIRRHDAFKTSFQLLDNRPVQRIHRDAPFNIRYYDTPDSRDNQELSDIITNFVQPFDLSRPPLLRLGIVKQNPRKHLLIADMHHIITDGNSMRPMITDFMALYQGRDLPALKLQYKDFSQWQQRLFDSPEIRKQEAYWLERFNGPIPQLNLPTDFPANDMHHYKGEYVLFEIDRQLTADIRKLIVDSQTTLFVVLLAVYNILLSKYTGREDIVVGTGLAGRRHADLENIIGFFINMLALRNRPARDKTFSQFLTQVKENTLDAYDNQDYQFEELVKKLNLQGKPARNPLFDVVLQVQNIGTTKLEIPDLTLTYIENENTFVRFDLVVYISEAQDTINMKIAYSTALFKRSTANDIAFHFCEILKQVIDDTTVKLDDITISEQFTEARPAVSQIEVNDFSW